MSSLNFDRYFTNLDFRVAYLREDLLNPSHETYGDWEVMEQRSEELDGTVSATFRRSIPPRLLRHFVDECGYTFLGNGKGYYLFRGHATVPFFSISDDPVLDVLDFAIGPVVRCDVPRLLEFNPYLREISILAQPSNRSRNGHRGDDAEDERGLVVVKEGEEETEEDEGEEEDGISFLLSPFLFRSRLSSGSALVSNREFLTIRSGKRLEDGSVHTCGTAILPEDAEPFEGVPRGFVRGDVVWTSFSCRRAVEESQSRANFPGGAVIIDALYLGDVGGWIPKFLANLATRETVKEMWRVRDLWLSEKKNDVGLNPES